MKKTHDIHGLSILGLLLITALESSFRYYLSNLLSEKASICLFLFLINIVGFVFLIIISPRSLISLNKTTLKKGLVLAVEISGFYFFFLLGTIGLDTVVSSSFFSIYFIFVTPLLLIMKKRGILYPLLHQL